MANQWDVHISSSGQAISIYCNGSNFDYRFGFPILWVRIPTSFNTLVGGFGIAKPQDAIVAVMKGFSLGSPY